MEQKLREAFEEFKFCTLECINSVHNDDYDALDNFILKRQEILNKISQMNCSAVECTSAAGEFDIVSLQKMLSDEILKRRKELRRKIDSIEKNITATNSYNNTVKSAVIFSKKI